MTTRKWLPVTLPFSIGLMASAVYSSFAISSESWGQVLGSLYYIPIVIAAIVPGVPSAFTVALAAGIVHTVAATLGHGDHSGRTDCPDPSFRMRSGHCRATRAVACGR